MKKSKLITVACLTVLLLLTSFTVSFAQFRTDSNTVTTVIGNGGSNTSPGAGNSTLAEVATEITTVISSACNGAVTAPASDKNIPCMQGLSLPDVPYPNLAVSAIITSATGNNCDDNNPSLGTCLQCVGFVQGVVAGAYGAPLDNGGNAKDFATNVPTGYRYIPQSSGTPPQEGDIIIKTGGDYGHIAIVTKVYDSVNIQVAEANYDLAGGIRLKNTAVPLWNGWLRKQ